MGQFFNVIEPEHRAFIVGAPLFFVATAAEGARINLSPKGMDCFRVLGPNRVAWLDVGGSGNETNAHLLADGRITVMFCAFENPALILRLYGRGVPVLPQDSQWDALIGHFDKLPGTRQIFDMTVESVQTSCGYGVPHMRFERTRDTLSKLHGKYSEETMLGYWSGSDQASIDGLPIRWPSALPRA